jgi:adenylate cyclase
MRQRCAKAEAIFAARPQALPDLSAITRYKLRKLLKYGLVTTAVGAVLMLFSGQHRWAFIGAWAVLGVWTGVLEEFLFGRTFRSLAIPLQLLGKALAVNLLTIAFIFLALTVDVAHALPFSGDEGMTVGQVMASGPFYRLALQVVVVTSVAILVVQVEELMGRRYFLGFLLGWYDKPREVERVILSIDLVGSSALNEKMGDMRYFRFLNVTHSLMTDAVLRNDAEIHKYVGDEVIFIWSIRSGTHDLNCLDLFFDIQERLRMHDKQMLRDFGAVPQFRAGLHGGRVISAQVGHIKRAIDLSGDVMNTTRRVLDLCKELKADLLVTDDLLQRMPNAGKRFSFSEGILLRIKGGKRRMVVHRVERTAKNGS